MMDSSLIDQWNAYPEDMKTRMLQTAATVFCTHRFMFWPENKLDFQGLQDYQYSTSPEYKIFRFAQGSQIPLKGPFSMHSNVCHYYSCSDAALKDYATAMGEIMTQYTLAEKYIDSVTCCADNFRYPTYCEQYGRRRPGTADNLNGRPGRSSIPANKLNEIYNLDIAQMVSDDRWGSNKRGVGKEDGLACDSPTSYPSGHSAQIWALAMILGSMHPENLQTYMSEAYKYSVNRAIGRYHWNSDCMYGRLFGTITLPLINAVNVMEDGYKALKDAVDQEPVKGDWNVKLYINNKTGKDIQSTGEIRMYVRNHIGVNTYLPGAAANAGALYTFKTGTNDFTSRDVHCVMNGEAYMDDSYNGAKITEVRFYDYRHYNNIDAGFNIALDTSDSKCDTVLKKSGATYVLRITNL